MIRPRPARVALVAVCCLTALWLVLPTLFVIPMSFSPARSFAIPTDSLSLQWYENFFSDPRWLGALRTSTYVAALTMLVATTVGTLAALVLDRAEFPGKSLVSALLMTPLIIPLVLLGLGIYYVFLRWRLTGTITGLVLAHSLLAVPLAFRAVAASLQAHDRRVELAAASLGASPPATFRQVTLPLILPGVASGAIFAFIASFDEIVISIFLTSPTVQTLPVLMFNAVTRELDPTIAAASTLILGFTTVLIVFGLWLLKDRKVQL